jgi:hypothetical protein
VVLIVSYTYKDSFLAAKKDSTVYLEKVIVIQTEIRNFAAILL